ncbi:MAG: hypothetical protein FJW97_00170 [Actinobacteria bacterium]|nr:hypothetical protein [Actinomycetota bacterium]
MSLVRRPDLTLRWTLIAIVAVLVVSLLGEIAHRWIGEPVAEPAVTREPIASQVLLCPEPGAGGDLGVRVTGAVVPGQPGEGPGSAGLVTLPGTGSASTPIRQAGEQGQIEAFGTSLPPVVAFGEGSLAPGLVADQWGRDPSGKGRGMASTACAPAASDFWFVGGGAVAGRRTRVVMVNPDETAAIVDVIIHGPDGVIDSPASRGLVVKGRERLVLPLDVVAPGVNGTAIHVIVRAGRVGASVDDEQRTGLASIGTDWIPQAAAPATRVYVPGVINGDGARVLSVAAVGEDDAIVKVRILAQEGAYAPADRGTIQVPAQSVATLDLAPILPQTPDGVLPATVELTSDTLIVAGMRQFFGGRRVQDDTSFVGGSQPFIGPAAVTGLPVRAATDVRLSITAPESPAAVDITLLPFRGGREVSVPTSPTRVQVEAGQLRWVKLEPPTDVDWYTAIVTPAPDSGPVLVAHRVREKSRFGDLITGYSWRPLRTDVVVPVATQDIAVAAN